MDGFFNCISWYDILPVYPEKIITKQKREAMFLTSHFQNSRGPDPESFAKLTLPAGGGLNELF